MRRISLLIFLSVGLIYSQGLFQKEDNFDEYVKVTQFILKRYPEASLIDIYKYFFQSRFGPEHIVSDSLIALKMLKEELELESVVSYRKKSDSSLVEILYPEKKYVRIDLSLIKDRIIPLELFFSAFLQSVEKHDSLDFEKWKSDWEEIVRSIESANIKIKNFKEDKAKIETGFRWNKIVFHHSQDYRKIYNPHYRLINYKIFEKFLLPYLKQSRIKFIDSFN
jgi:hypothetical protein